MPFMGYKYTEEHKRKMSIAHSGEKHHMFGKHHSEATKLKISLAQKISMLGKQHTKETKKKISESLKGSNNPNWKGGISPEKNKRVSSAEWKELRKQIYKRDNYTCQICGKHCKKQEIQAHHIIPYHISKDNNLTNLITLCFVCHMKEERKILQKFTGSMK